MRNKGIKIIINIFITVATTTVIFGYAYFRTQDYLQGPKIILETPENGTTIVDHNPLVPIMGTTEHVSAINLNGRKIFIDKDGNFNENILLYTGYNIITIEATDRFKKTITKKLEIIYQDS